MLRPHCFPTSPRHLCAALLSAALLSGAAASPARADQAVDTATATKPLAAPITGGPFELGLFGSVGGPAGSAGVSVAYLPLPRLAFGLSLGRVGLDRPFYGETEGVLGAALFARGYVISTPIFRLGAGLSLARHEDATHHARVAAEGTLAEIYWNRLDALRVDGTVALELFHGNVGLRLEGGLGRVWGDASCSAHAENGLSPCAPSDGSSPLVDVGPQSPPSAWRPSLTVGLVVRPGGERDAEPAAFAAPAPRQAVRLSLAGTHVRHTGFMNDGHWEDGPAFDVGANAEYLRTIAGGWRWGVGARYSWGTGKPALGSDHRENEHVGFVPLLIGWAWRSQATGEEVELISGLGVAAMSFSFGDPGAVATGFGGEASVNYIRPFTARTALVLGVTARALVLNVKGSSDSYYLQSASGIHAEIPVQVGLRIAL